MRPLRRRRPTSEAPRLFTIGHSTRTVPQFGELLRAGRVERVVDVRTIPRSRTNPQYNLDALPGTLADYQIAHARIASLGGLRSRQADIPPDVNGWWTNQSFHNYADHALSDAFAEGFAELLAFEGRTAVMCSEAVWWRCHRRIIADYALNAGREVFHLMGADKVERARITPAAVPKGDRLVYPPAGPA